MAEHTFTIRAAGGTRLPKPPRPRKRNRDRRRPPGRHRYGTPGLRHRAAQRGGRQEPRHAAPVPTHRRRTAQAVALVVASTLLISGWFAAAGATAFAEMISR